MQSLFLLYLFPNLVLDSNYCTCTVVFKVILNLSEGLLCFIRMKLFVCPILHLKHDSRYWLV